MTKDSYDSFYTLQTQLRAQLDSFGKRLDEIERRLEITREKEKSGNDLSDFSDEVILNRLSKNNLASACLPLWEYNYVALRQARELLRLLNHHGGTVLSEKIMVNAIVDLDTVMQELGNPFEASGRANLYTRRGKEG